MVKSFSVWQMVEKGLEDGSWILVQDYEDKHLLFRITCTDESFTITPERCIETVHLDFVLTLNLFSMYVCFAFTFAVYFLTQFVAFELVKIKLWVLSFAGECKYDFQAWGECDSTMRMKTRTGVLKRALMDANCPNTVSATKPCGKPKTKIQGTRTHT